tara:strand:- start:311 stop:412 length:102 start_codon:yes stop_codon:yes gene_type:complete
VTRREIQLLAVGALLVGAALLVLFFMVADGMVP